ncbi:MAG TPA: hypothetical protein DD473_08390 [Planctomycetaceae bacterium]|nr:hypothetical protein [Planctomycetaceae bacterium]
MKLSAINCEQCRAPLEVPMKATSVRCGYCNSQLILNRSQSHPADVPANNTGCQELDPLQKELEQLDNEWKKKRQSYMDNTQDGEIFIPHQTMLLAIIGFTVMCFWTCYALYRFPILALFGGFAIFAFSAQFNLARKEIKQYQTAHSAYRMKRQEILSQIGQNNPPGIDNFIQDLSFN